MNSFLLSGAVLALVAQAAYAVVVPWPGSNTKVAGDLVVNACKDVPAGMTVCYPFKKDKFIECAGTGKPGVAKKCPKGTLYDYLHRECIPKGIAKPCPAFPCPTNYACKNASDPSIAWPPCRFININDTYNTMGVSELLWPARTAGYLPGISPGPKNYTLTLTTKGSAIYFDPVVGRCTSGSWMKVTTLGVPPDNRPPKTFNVLWESPLNNGMAYPAKIPDITAYIGDKIFFYWTGAGDFAFTGLAAFNPSAPDAAPVIPYPPQPLYSCPVWIAIKDDPVVGRVIPLLGGEVRVHDAFRRPKTPGSNNAVPQPLEVKITADHFGGLFANPSPPGCRKGMVFKVTQTKENRTPKIFNITWEWTMQNHPDLEVTVGDVLSFNWHSPGQIGTPFQSPVAFQLLQPNGLSFLPATSPGVARANTWRLRESCRTEKNLNLTIYNDSTKYNVTQLNLGVFEACNACAK